MANFFHMISSFNANVSVMLITCWALTWTTSSSSSIQTKAFGPARQKLRKKFMSAFIQKPECLIISQFWNKTFSDSKDISIFYLPKNCNEMTLLHKMYLNDIQIQVCQKYLPVWCKIDPSRIPSFSSFQSLALLKVQGSFQKFLFWKHLWITSACTWVELLGFVFLLGWALILPLLTLNSPPLTLISPLLTLISPLQNLILPLLTLHWGNFATCSDFLFQAPPKPRSSWYIIIIKITLILIISSNLGWQTPCLGQNESTLAFSSQVITWKASNVIAYNRKIKSTLKSWKEQLRW